jgi:hypothetical protein
MIVELKKVVPAENFRKEPEYVTSALLKFEAKHQLNTVDFLTGIRIGELDEDTRWRWLNEYETFKLFNGDETHINSIKNKGCERNER